MHPNDLDALFGQAVDRHLQGRLTDAIALYDAIIRLNPNVAPAHCNRAIALESLNRLDDALGGYDRAIKLNPDYVEAYNNRGNALLALRRPAEALESFERAISLTLQFPEAHYNKAKALESLNRPAEALASYDAAIKLRPGYSEAHYNRANVLSDLERPEEAIQSYDRAIQHKPEYPEAYNNRGNALRAVKRPAEALQSYEKAIALRPDYVEAHSNKGTALLDLNRPQEALLFYDKAIALRPDYADAYTNKGSALWELGRQDEAFQCYERAIELDPNHAEAYCNKGQKLRDLGRLYEAIECYDKAIAIKPNLAEAYWDKALCTLIKGDFEQGLPLYEWRKKRANATGLRNSAQPEWTGRESLDGKTLFIHAEQGFGDTIQFCRYAPLALGKGAQVILGVPDRLVHLLKNLGPEIEIVPFTAAPAAFDMHVALMSMPLAFATTLSSCPAKVPYLRAEPETVAKWRKRIGPEGFKIGICWQGNKQGEADVGRSFPVRHFEGIAKLPNVRLISLQKNDGVEQLADLPLGMTVEALGEKFDAGPDAFIDTAAVMECLDIVVTSDTAIAHLAGALGRPVWVALKYVPDWRWLLDRADSPWYPTMRLFRQAEPEDWASVFADMVQALIKLLTNHAGIACA